MFSEQDLAKIQNTVRDAERRTRGEIVPMVVDRSARYREAHHALGLLFAVMTIAALLWWDHAGWGGNVSAPWILIGGVIGYAFGHVTAFVPWVLRMVVSPQRMDNKVRLRAEAAFHKHGLHKTREGTGILIMISLLERRVQILADKAINEKVIPSTWDDLVGQLITAIHEGKPTEGLCRTIERCGELLAAHFPAHPHDNPDELRDDLIRER